MKENDNSSLFTKVLGDIFLIVALFVGFVFISSSLLLAKKDPATFTYYFSIPVSIIISVFFLAVGVLAIVSVMFDMKKLIPYSFLASSLLSLGIVFALYFTIISKMKVGSDESFFSTVKFTFSFYLLLNAGVIALSSVMPVLGLTKGIFNSFLHSVSYIVEAVLWVLLFTLTAPRMGTPIALLVAALLFLRSGTYWWLLIYRKELRKKREEKKKANDQPA